MGLDRPFFRLWWSYGCYKVEPTPVIVNISYVWEVDGWRLDALVYKQPDKLQYAPHKWNQPAYGKKIQFAPEPGKSKQLDTKEKKLIQSTVGAFLYYSRAMDPTILPALNDISIQQSKPTKKNGKGKNVIRLHVNVTECSNEISSWNDAIDGGHGCGVPCITGCKIMNCWTVHASIKTQYP